MVRPGHGLLACDESTGTVGTRLESIGMENSETNRRDWRELLFTAPNLGKYISGAILYEETLFQSGADGQSFVDKLNGAGIIPGIKVDMGLKELVGGGPKETWCSGLDGLLERCQSYYAQGARFAKWRTAVRIDTENSLPSQLAVDEAAHGLARYARICQEAGLVPIVEPEILIDGTHDLATTAVVQERLITTVYKYLQESGVFLEGSLLKPSMTVSGVDCPNKPSPAEIAVATVRTFERSIPPAMPGVTFLSGGISEEDASIYLNEINKIERKGPWALTFSFSRAMQSSCIKKWMGKPENKAAAQAQLVARAQANAEASTGSYKPGSQPSDEASLYVKDYSY
jgi:fructose-bisphosphate aldolase class I